MLLKVLSFVLFLLFFGFSCGLEIDYRYFKLYLQPIYPVKKRLYSKEPIFIRFDIYIKENKTGLRKELLLSFIRVEPADKNILISQQERFIHPYQLKLTSKNLLYLRSGETRFPFLVYFDTNMMKGLLSETVLKELSRKHILKSEDVYTILPVPSDVRFVGSFDIKTQLKKDEKTAILTILIKGKGYPDAPNYTLVVKNGSARKIASDIKNNMGYITAVQKYRIIYMDKIEVLPVSFKFFDPFQEKVVEKKTDLLKLSVKKKEALIKKLSEKKKAQLYIDEFKKLYPEYFVKRSIISKIVEFLLRIKEYILLSVALLILTVILIFKRFVEKKLPERIKQIVKMRIESLNDIRKLYRYAFSYEDVIGSYLELFDQLFYRSEIEKRGRNLIKIRKDKTVYTPSDILKLVNNIKKKMLEVEKKKLPEKWRKIVDLYFFVSRNFFQLVLLFLAVFVSGIIQTFAHIFPDLEKELTVLNFLAVFILFLFFLITRKPLLKV